MTANEELQRIAEKYDFDVYFYADERERIMSALQEAREVIVRRCADEASAEAEVDDIPFKARGERVAYREGCFAVYKRILREFGLEGK